jgi:hypothetical protein
MFGVLPHARHETAGARHPHRRAVAFVAFGVLLVAEGLHFR